MSSESPGQQATRTQDGAAASARPVGSPRRMTRQRAAVDELLRSSDVFVSAQDLHARLRDGGDRVGLATVYRLLQSMADEGQVDVRRGEAGEMTFRRCSTRHHHHLVCRRCGRADEVTSPQIEDAVTDLARAGGYSAVEHSVEIIGVCAACALANGRTT